MKHYASPSFYKRFSVLPAHVQVLARTNFGLLKRDPEQPFLHFEAIGRFRFMRVGSSFRALAVAVDDRVVWFWIGGQDEYERLVAR